MNGFNIDAELVAVLRDLDEDELQAFANLHGDATNKEQVELSIYCCVLIFKKSHDTEHLEPAIQLSQEWITAISKSHPDYNRRCSILSTLTVWSNQYRINKGSAKIITLPNLETEIIDEAGVILRHLNNQAADVAANFEHSGFFEHLDAAIMIIEKAMNIAKETALSDNSIMHIIFFNLKIWLTKRFVSETSIADMDRVVGLLRKALEIITYDSPVRASYLNYLGFWLSSRYELEGSIDDLNEAVSVGRDAEKAISPRHLNRGVYLQNLGRALSRRFEETSSMADLNEAIRVTSAAVDIIPHHDPGRANSLNSLGGLLGARFGRIGSLADLNRAINIAVEALDVTPHGSLERSGRLNTLGIILCKRYKRMGSIADLDQAIDVLNNAISIAHDDDIHRTTYLDNLGKFLIDQFQLRGSQVDLDKAIEVASAAVDDTAYNHPNRAMHLRNLGFNLGQRYKSTGSINDLNQAIDVTNNALGSSYHDRWGRGDCLNTLGMLLGWRFEQTGSTDDMERRLSLYIENWHCNTASTSQRIHSAQYAAKILISQQNWKETSQLLQDVILLLPTISSRSLRSSDAQVLLADTIQLGLPSLAAAAALNAGKPPEDALRLLELGRGVIAGMLMDMRGDISDLKMEHPDLAAKLNHLRDELETPVDHTILLSADTKASSWELSRERRHKAEEEFDQVINIIRTQPGFSGFLQPQTTEDLMSAAEQGPVITVNISSIRCDALIVERNSIRVVELPDLTLNEVGKQVNYLAAAKSNLPSSLEWLWHNICYPILNALNYSNPILDDNWPHVWWIPTGILSIMPLHAAGIYKHASKDTVLDRAISSYASSIKSLLHGPNIAFSLLSHL